jgi:Fe-S oxidoreductase
MEFTGLQIAALVTCLAATVVGVALFARTVGMLARTVRLGQPTERSNDPGLRTRTLLREFLGHTRMMKIHAVGIAHWFVMVSFGLLFLTLLTAYGQLFDPEFALPLIGHFAPLEWLVEAIAWLSLFGILTLIGIRQQNHPRRFADSGGRRSRFYGSSFWQAYYVEATILGVVICVITLRALEYALPFAVIRENPVALFESPLGALHHPLTAWLGGLFDGASSSAIKNAIVIVAAVKILISMAWFVTIALQPTMGVAWHRFLAFLNIWFKRHAGGRTSLGALQPISVDGKPLDFENLDELDEDAALGVGKVEDFTWKGLLDFSTCTECGRCQSQCPAWNTDKPLSPKLMIMALRDHAHGKAPWLLATSEQRAELGDDVKAQAERPLVGTFDPQNPLSGGVIDPDVLWSCVTCGACVEQCPVDIEHVDHIVDLRRYQVLIESAFPAELNGLFRNLEKQSNPWGVSSRERLGWAKNLPFEVKVVGGGGAGDPEDLSEVDYLFWVGCAGAFEDRQKKTTQAVAELLHSAGVSFAVLGDGESCTGDPARRSGNEFLFQQLAIGNVEVLNESKATKIVVTCAHCFNTLTNEYPQLGGNYEVVHHTQLLNRLVRDRRLVPIAPVSGPGSSRPGSSGPAATPVTYHDPCYLGRHNGVYSPPRELIGALPGVTLTEMPRNSEKSFCCGAGGARMWMEEKIGTRINATRTAEAVATGAQQIAVACPFCRVMLSDGLTTAQADGKAAESVEVIDIAQMLLAAVNRSQ